MTMTEDSIEADLDRGETPILLVELTNQSFIPRRNGKKPHKSVPFRWRDKGLETKKSPAGYFTTKSAWFRFLDALETPNPTRGMPVVEPNVRDRQVEAAHLRTAAAGI